MQKNRRKVEELLWITGLHSIARSAYRAVSRHRPTEKLVEFYRGLVPPGSLVFDIGANVGLFSEALAILGCRVVALEPNSDCLRHIEISYPKYPIERLQAVVGPKNGLAVINMSDDKDVNSSLSEEWIAWEKKINSRYEEAFVRRVTIPMITLDTMIEQYGEPSFIKIDVEGFEESVLDGLSTQPQLVSFEFNTGYFDAISRCLNKPVFQAKSTFNLAFGTPEQIELPTWVGRDEIMKYFDGLPRQDRYGDIFVKRPAQ